MNKYDSLYTGAHNDGYEPRIKTLEDQTLDTRITALEQQVASLSTSLSYISSHYLPMSIIETSSNFDNYTTTGLYIIKIGDNTNYATNASNHGLLLVMFDVGTPYQLYIGDSSVNVIRKRYWNGSSWSNWFSIGENLVQTSSSQSVNFTTKITTGTSSWVTWLNGWVAPSHGWLVCYMSANGGSTPSAALVDNTNGFRLQQNGNGSRDYALSMPVIKGHNYSGSSVYTATNSLTFYPSVNNY